MVVLLTHVLCPRKKHVSHLTSATRLACSSKRVILTDVRYWFLCGASSLVSATFEGSEGGSFSSVDCQLFYFLL